MLPDSEPRLRLKYTFNDTTELDYICDVGGTAQQPTQPIPEALPGTGQTGHNTIPIRGLRLLCPLPLMTYI
jgi:hypothetical protein